MNIDALKTRIDELIAFAQKVEKTRTVSPRMGHSVVSKDLAAELRAVGLSFINRIFGEKHPFYSEFDKAMGDEANSYYPVVRGRGVLQAIKQEIDGGRLSSVKGLVSAEIFTDFLEMANHLLHEGYKDPAAVMIGSVLEEHLRQLCTKNEIETTFPDAKTGRDVPKKADRINNDLAAAGVYNKLYHKTILGWLDLRNQAAHGHYAEYDVKQVKLMEDGVTDFIAKTT